MTVALASVPALPRVARADDAAVVEAKARFDEGLKLADEGKPEPARLKFQQAYAVFKAPAVLYNLARAEQLTGHDLEALEHFRLFLRVGATDAKITDSMREKARQNAADLARSVGQIDIEVPSTARVTLDGKPLDDARTPREPVPVSPGKHTIEATFDGKVKSISVECTAGNVVKAKIEFETGGAIEPLHEQPAGFWTTGRVTGATIGLVGVAALGVGIFFALKAGSTSDDAATKRATLPDPQSSCTVNPGLPQCGELKTLESDYKTAGTLRTAFVGSGAALAVGGAVLFVVSGPKKSEPARGMRLVPIATTREAGFSLAGTF